MPKGKEKIQSKNKSKQEDWTHTDTVAIGELSDMKS